MSHPFRRTLLISAFFAINALIVAGIATWFSPWRALAFTGEETWFSQDIGDVAVAGSASYDDQADEFTVSGSGGGIGGAADAGHFNHLFLNGDGSIVARIIDVENTAAEAFGGIAIRQNIDSGAIQMLLGAKPDGSLHVVSRTVVDAVATSASVSSGTFPRWIRLTRSGDDFTYATSMDGSAWTDVDTIEITMDEIVRIGLFVTSADDGELCTAVFESVTTTGNTEDIDLDGLPDSWERHYFGNLSQGSDDDPDQDGLTNLEEYQAGTSPVNPDTDGDGMPDGWEVAHGLDPLSDNAGQDSDGDGLTNLQELQNGTNPALADTDGDGLPDGWEVSNGANPLVDDAADDPDGDGISHLLAYQLETSRIVALKFDEGSGVTAYDTSGNGNHGALDGPNWMIGRKGNALSFDGVDDSVAMGAVSLGDQFTIVLMAKLPDPLPSGSLTLLANSADGAATDGFRLHINTASTSDGKVIFESGNGTSSASAATFSDALPLEIWSHIAVVVDRVSEMVAIYINGVDVTDSSAVLADFANNLAVQVGQVEGGGAFLEGALDELQLYGRKLSAADIAALAAAQLDVAIPIDGLSLWLKADDGVEADANQLVSSWTDQSGNANHAIQSNNSLKPKRIFNAINGKPVLRFDGADDFLTLPAATSANMTLSDFRDGLTAIVVAKPNQLQTTARFLTLSRGSSSNVVSIAYNKPFSYTEVSPNLEYYISNPSSGITTLVAWHVIDQGQFKAFQVTQTPGSGSMGDVEIHSNGWFIVDGEVEMPNYSLANPRNQNYVGRSSYSNQPYLNADIAEVILYQRPLSTAERRQIDFYLYQKYRIPIYLPEPDISPAGGTSDPSAILVEINTAETPPPGVEFHIRYTTDGTDPTWNSPGFPGPSGDFTLARSAIVKARVFLDANTAGEIANSMYWVNDADQDGMDDDWEVMHGFDPDNPSDAQGDADGDGLTNLQEFLLGTNPNAVDSNGDGLSDYTNVQLGRDPAAEDPDGDGLTNAQELALGTDPLLADTDGDGVPDHLDAYPLDPTRWEVTPPDSNDTTPPTIQLHTPAHAVPVP